MKNMRVIISGGGTGGHIFPAIAIANSIKERYPDATILFVGAERRMEMEKVPAAGYDIIGLQVAGLNRKNLFKNIGTLWKFYKSLRKSEKILKEFKPDIVIGVGGYVSGSILYKASSLKIPTLIQEQNSYAGVTNKFLGKRVSKICVAYEGMEKFFPQDKIVLTGNPCRQELFLSTIDDQEAYAEFGLDPSKKTILLIGGSLGSATLNKSILNHTKEIADAGIQIIWQCGRVHLFNLKLNLDSKEDTQNVHLFEFINRMDLAYHVADLVISRAGASSISELSILGKPTILVPSPNVAEDHQTKNALALAEKNAAIMIPDSDAVDVLIKTAIELIHDDKKLLRMSYNISKMALPDSANHIVDEVEKLIERK